jgi:hypothetical protein
MSKEEVREHVDKALETAVAKDVSLDDVETILRGAEERVHELRVVREGK